jgi:hypothetical protein
LLPFMTSKEHGLLSRCAAIYLLGFFNPNSTGCEFSTLRSTISTTEDAFFDMELEERLENTSRFFQAHEFGQVNVCTDVNRERAFQSFIKNGLTPFLSNRSAHPNQTDVLHLVAMAIAPQLSTDVIDNVVAPFEEKQVPAWIQTRRLMGCLYAHSFPLHYDHRFLLVQMVTQQVVLPETDSPHMIAGAVPHLLAALHTFAAHSARTVAHAHVAHQGLARIATQTGQEWIVREVFYILLAQTLEDRNRCKCPLFCPHAARGNLLRECISTFDASRHYADGHFTGQACMALNASIEEQMEPWLKESDEEPHGACLLSSLLNAAEALFFSSLEGDGDVNKRGLLEMSIQLLHHPDPKVRQAASSLLSVAFSYTPSQETGKLMVPVLGSIKSALEAQFQVDTTANFDQSSQQVMTVSARNSSGFASSLLSYILKERSDKWKSQDKVLDAKIADRIARVISNLSCANPMVAFQQAELIRNLLTDETSITAKGHLVAALLATRQAYPFGKDDEATQTAIRDYLSENNDHWRDFIMARHALATGNFSVAKSIYDGLLTHTSSEDSFLWITALSKLAEAESHLLDDGARGIPAASTLIQSAVSYIELLSSQNENSMMFQIDFLRLRLDFLDLSAATRLICRETRLSGTVPKDTSRVGLHLVNTLKSWGALATRYHSLYRRYGLFLCLQSRTTLRTMHSICRQIGRTGMQILSEAIKNKADVDVPGPKGDRMHPTIQLLQKINDSILPNMDKFVEPAVRATALIEVLEGVHRSPIPFPRSFTRAKKVPRATLRISLDPSQPDLTLPQEDLNMPGLPSIADSTAIYPGTNLTVFASGSIPEATLQEASTPLSQLLLWSRIRFVSSLHDDYAVDEEESDAQKPNPHQRGQVQNSAPVEIQLSSTSTKFVVPLELQQIKAVGIYRVDYHLGCRDIGSGEWELPVDRSGNTILIRVTRRLDHMV